jgi:hypothetical protein
MTEEEQVKKWESMLDTMIFTFSQIDEESNTGNLIWWHEGRKDSHWEEFIKKWPNTRLQTKEEYDRVQEGLKLYIEYYQALWD